MSKGGGKGHTPREAKDDLKSTQQLSVIDALSEGPIVGPVNGLQSVLINNTPVVDADGNSNIHGVTVVYQVGETPQAPLEGFEASGAETVLGVEVKHDNPVTRTVVSENVDRLRFTFGVQMLQETTDKGDRNPSSVNLLIQFQRSGIWNTEFDITINGKITCLLYTSGVILAQRLPVCWWMRNSSAASRSRVTTTCADVFFRSPQTMTRIPAHIPACGTGRLNRRTRITRRGARWIN